jgi:hypothetical protein
VGRWDVDVSTEEMNQPLIDLLLLLLNVCVTVSFGRVLSREARDKGEGSDRGMNEWWDWFWI